MYKLRLTILALLVSSLAFSQDYSKTTEIFKIITGQKFNVVKTYKDGELTDKTYYFYGQNRKYSYITDLITIYSGDKEGFKNFIDDLLSFLNEYSDGTSMEIGKTRAVISMSMGAKMLTVHVDGGYTWFGKHELKRIQKKLSKVYDKI